ncbi:MAG TPA: glycosyltransferase [Thermoanaerobaculaceae bacterium]|nr:glycosyltransferase [Thermoanaerobaculaceae bacterium]
MTDATHAPLVTVVVVNFNGRHHLERCLPALFATAGVEFEVVVADNGSTDGSAELIARRWPEAKVLAIGRNVGFGAANNRAAAAARGEFVAFLNNDTEVEPGWLTALLEPLQADPEIGASCSTLRLLGFRDLLNGRGGGMTSAGYGYDIDFMVPVERPPATGPAEPWHDVLFPTAAAALVRRREFLDIGGFDPAIFMYHEDVDLGLRIWLAGRRVVCCVRSIVYHAWGGTSHREKGLRWRERLGMRHNVRTLLKCYRGVNLLRSARRIGRIWLVHRAFGQAISTCWWNLVKLPSTLRERRRIQRGKVRTEGDLFRMGLITGAAWPPPPPEPPSPEVRAGTADWLQAPTLLPGEHSALGRLGPGWFAAEKLDGRRVRWTCGVAHCVLRVAPGEVGRLEVEATLGPEARLETVRVRCNDAAAAATVGPGWTAVTLAVRADDRGLLRVAVDSPPWTPHDVRGNWDFRLLGCAVRAVRFRPEREAQAVPPPRVSVIVPTFNRWPILERNLEALAAQTYERFEVIVVDDGSTDETWDRLQAWRREHADRLELKILHQENLKPGRARNLALRHADGDLVLFLGDDIIAEPDLVAEHAAAHVRQGEPAAILGFTDWDRSAVRVTPFLELINRDGQQFSYGHFRDGEDLFFTCFYTSNISLPRDVLGDEPFHPAFTFVDWEDTELGYRLSRRGLRLILHCGARACHVHPMTMSGFFRRQQHVGRTVGVLLDLHPELARSEAMPPLRPRRWYPVASPIVAAALPLVSWLDTLKVRFPVRMYRAMLLTAFFDGRAVAARLGSTP